MKKSDELNRHRKKETRKKGQDGVIRYGGDSSEQEEE